MSTASGVGSRFVQVPAAAIRERLAAAGFLRVAGLRGEEVYDRVHDKNPAYAVRVYSSIMGDAARGCGEDAIRVVALFVDSKAYWPARVFPIFKATRVFRTGTVEGVLDRLIERAREAYKVCNEHRRKP